MTDTIRVGTMLVADNTPMPATLVVGTERYAAGWSSIVGSTSAQLDKEIENVGWTFFYMAGEIRTIGFGFNDHSRASRAVARIVNAVKREKCNCLEITQMRQRSFLGFRYTSLVAHARHIQKSRSFHDPSNMSAGIRFRSREWLYDQPATVRSRSLFAGEAVQTWENEGGSRAEPIPST
jgi:hypothetical protein